MNKHLKQLASMRCIKLTYPYVVNEFRLKIGIQKLMEGERGMQLHDKMLNKFELSNLN